MESREAAVDDVRHLEEDRFGKVIQVSEKECCGRTQTHNTLVLADKKIN